VLLSANGRLVTLPACLVLPILNMIFKVFTGTKAGFDGAIA